MADPFIGEIRLLSFSYPPKNWAPCSGQLLSIAQNQALFSLLGTTFGGDGITTFGLPDLRGRVPRHPDNSNPQGAKAGVENVTLNATQVPPHTHQVMVSSKTNGSQDEYENAVIGLGLLASANPQVPANVYAPANAGATQALTPGTVSSVGGNQPHTNLQPSLVTNFCISLAGIYPSRP
ncbi:MAG TPA: tail fiber protein [Gammaproteobacteria bacterium]|nr:tail fiber protein [Gammaproteobacteria bacterium]